ncbi:MAG: adenosylcobinamide-phosphate synthase CbiB [Clostridium sp.]|uniref:adenosylcobinamide-phosphate synthase CbiB n=1 Tax=Clostridium sp. TaxID=1506 RepID=UPI003EE7E80F
MSSLLLGFILDQFIGDPENPYHPVRYIGNLGMGLEKLFRKLFRNALKFAGLLTWIATILISYFITLVIVGICQRTNIYLDIIVNGIIIYFCIASKGLIVEGLKVIEELKSNNIDGARKKLSYIVGRDTNNLDEESIIRAVIETVAENMSDGIIAPLLFIGLGGAPLGIVYKAVNTCDSMFGYKNDKYKDFGFFPAKLDDVFNYIPARITGYLIVIASFLLGLDYKSAYKIYKRDKNNHSSPNSAHPEASIAGMLGVQLGGDNYYFGKLVKKQTIGDKNKKIKIEDLYNVNKVLIIVSYLGLIISLLLRGVILK